MLDLSISQAADLLRTKKVSPVELTNACLERIEKLNPVLNAFITVTRESALKQARIAEDEIQNGNSRGLLHGIPIGLKDLFDTAGIPTTCGSALFVDRIPTEDAEVLRRLNQAGAVVIGKQNMQEFAYGGTTTSSHFGPVRNPVNNLYIAGGSSGGSAAAVASGMCFGALGTDTGGSVRQPAAFCGLVGLKPTYGRVSTRGVFPLSWSLDHVGPICRNVQDAAIMFEAIAGYDPLDPLSVDWSTETYSLKLDRQLKIGVVREFFFADLDQDIAEATEQALDIIRELGFETVDETLPATPTTVQAPEVFAIHSKYFSDSPELYRPLMRSRLELAATIDTQTYVQARHELDKVRRSIAEVFTRVDLVVTPTTPVPPITIEEALSNPLLPPQGEVWLRNTRPFNALGIPAISVPCGVTKNGLPIGLQIAGPRLGEATLLAFAHRFEEARG